MSEAAAEPKTPVEKKGKGKLVGIMVALALILGAGAAGAVLAPRYLGKPAAAKTHEASAESEGEGAEAESEHSEKEKEAEEEEEEPEEKKKPAGEVHEIVNLQPLVVDCRAADGEIRHVKVGLSLELPEGGKAAELDPYVPRAREAAISYFRTNDFDQLSDPKNFATVVKDINKEILSAVGKKRVRRVVVTDFVAQ